MKIISIACVLLVSALFASADEGRVEKALRGLKEAKCLDSRFYGEVALISTSHEYFEVIMRSPDRVKYFETLAGFESNISARAYGFLGLWATDKKKFEKLFRSVPLNLEQDVPCMFTWGRERVSLGELLKTPAKTWRVFLFDKKL